MIAAVVGMCFLAAVPLFNFQEVPLTSENSVILLFDADNDSTTDLIVLDGRDLTIYMSSNIGRPLKIRLKEHTSAFDVADLDGNGFPELISVCEGQIIRYVLSSGVDEPEPEVLFEIDTTLASNDVSPYPHVLVAEQGDEHLLLLPMENQLELRNSFGDLIATYPLQEQQVDDHTSSRFLNYFPAEQFSGGISGSMEWEIRSYTAFEAGIPQKIFFPAERDGMSGRVNFLYRYHHKAGDEESGFSIWPSFPLRPKKEESERVSFAMACPGHDYTLVRICDPRKKGSDTNSFDISNQTILKYPGIPVMTRTGLPDFNGDGYVDLVLCNSPEPGGSINTITRLATTGDWPLNLTVHLFSPEKKRYEPIPAARIKCDVKIDWFVAGLGTETLLNCVLRDFNGDGKTDLGFSPKSDRFSVWLYGDEGFQRKPDYERIFPEKLEGVEFCSDLGERRGVSLGLRSKNHVYILQTAD